MGIENDNYAASSDFGGYAHITVNPLFQADDGEEAELQYAPIGSVYALPSPLRELILASVTLSIDFVTIQVQRDLNHIWARIALPF